MPLTMHHSLAVHPGVWLAEEIVAPRAITVSELARHFGVTRQAVSALLNGRAALSPDMAIRFEKAFGVRADTLIRMQAAHDMAEARARAGAIKVERLAA